MNFSNWLLEILNERNWSQSDLARASGLTRAAISYYLGPKSKKPDEDALKKIAHALKIPPETVFRAAGLLPEKPPKDELIDKIIYELDQLPEEERDEIYQYIQLRREINEKKERYASKAATQKRTTKSQFC